MSLAETITRAKGGDWCGSYGSVPTPGHSAKDRGLSVRDAATGDDIILNCFNDPAFDWKAYKDDLRRDGLLPEWESPRSSDEPARTAYVYHDATGRPTFRMVRTERAGKPKSFHAEHPNGGGWAKGMGGATPLPYRLPELLAGHADEVLYIVEGEKDADNLAALGLLATTNPNGAGKWRDDFSAHLKGRECIILPDNDAPGREHAGKVAASLAIAGVDHVIVDLPGLPDKGDVSDWIAAGGSGFQLASLAAEAWKAPAQRPAEPAAANANATATDGLPRVLFRDIRPRLTGLWLVKRLLATTGLACIYGHSGAAKSFWILDVGLHIAHGWDWCGRKVKRGLVVYVAAEGQTGFLNRIIAWKRHHGIADDADAPFVLVPCPINLLDPNADTPRLIALIREAVGIYGIDPAMIVIDTLSKTFGGGSEVTDDMTAYVGNCQMIASVFETLVAPVHHRPLNAESEDPRGHGSLKAGVDTTILLEAGKPKRYRVTKQKDGDMGEPGAFNLKVVELGHDEDGEPVTSCVVEHLDGPAPVVAKSGKKLSDKQSIAVDALRRAISDDGREAPPGIPADMLKMGLVARVTTIAAWRDRALAATATPDSKPDTLAKGFARHVDSLQALGVVQIWEGFAWLPG